MRRIASILALVVAAIGVAGCGGAEEPASTEQASAPSAPILGGSRGGADQAAPATGAASTVAFADSTAEEAVATHINRYMAGDFAGALEICDMTSEGAKQLELQINGMNSAKADGVQIDMAMLLVQNLEGIRWERVEEGATDDRVEFLLIVPGRQRDKTCTAVLVDGVWRVQPDASGNP